LNVRWFGIFLLVLVVAVVMFVRRSPQQQNTASQALTAEQQAGVARFMSEAEMLAPPFPPLRGVPTASIAEGDKVLAANELVIGVEFNGVARAYPINMLNDPERKVVNDVIGESAIMVTWCDLCHSCAVFRRSVRSGTAPEEYGCSGFLWNESLVMYDVETRSFWNQIAGKCIAGLRAGEQLVPLPSVVTSWSQWKEAWPKTDILAASHVSEYLYSSFYHEPKQRNKFCYAHWAPYDGIAFTLNFLAKNPVLTQEINGDRLVFTTNPQTFGVRTFRSDIDGKRLTLLLTDGEMQDAETSSVWNMQTGLAVSGPYAGKRLEHVPGYLANQSSWNRLNPNGTVVFRLDSVETQL